MSVEFVVASNAVWAVLEQLITKRDSLTSYEELNRRCKIGVHIKSWQQDVQETQDGCFFDLLLRRNCI